MKILLAVCSLLSLALCLLAPVLYFLGYLAEKNYKLAFLLASFAWFFLATTWVSYKKKKPF